MYIPSAGKQANCACNNNVKAPLSNQVTLESATVVDAKTAATIDWIEEAIKTASPIAPYFKAIVNKYRKTGHDGILRGAPCLIAAIAPKNFMPRGRDNTHFSLAYAELYAPTLELGTCWAGFFEACALSGYQPLLDLLKLPEDMSVTGGIMVGYPKYTYKRLVDRKPLQVIWQ
ncbi:nitroreductase family protein [Pelosinus baikalensis]|uniref:Nitroreductase family protein n=1 Tax=Pelosinus baikalensis TaxID=2892015 RepID=A0ABS8HYQ8_9FIRM|nr:nitroreductase family protein [Pelosinus baikalensis]MCC5467378.1 nitroreductase family protein [Pelosinus baikalensis]